MATRWNAGRDVDGRGDRHPGSGRRRGRGPGARARGRGDARQRPEVGPLHRRRHRLDVRAGVQARRARGRRSSSIRSCARSTTRPARCATRSCCTRAEALGGGGYPHTAPQRNDQYVHGELRLEPGAGGPAPGPRFVVDRVHPLWITPYGVMQGGAAQQRAGRHAHASTARPMTTLTFTEPGRFRAVALSSTAGASMRVESRMPDPVLGETDVVTTYADYRDFGGFAFPTRITQIAGRLPDARPHRARGRAERAGRHRAARRRAHRDRARHRGQGRRRRVVHRRRLAQQRRDRDEGLHDPGRDAAQRRPQRCRCSSR